MWEDSIKLTVIICTCVFLCVWLESAVQVRAVVSPSPSHRPPAREPAKTDAVEEFNCASKTGLQEFVIRH